MVNLKKLCVGALLATTICGMGALTPSAEAGKIEDVQARGVLLVGSTGDYKPMSYLNKETGKYFVDGSMEESKENIIKDEHEKEIVDFLTKSLHIA